MTHTPRVNVTAHLDTIDRLIRRVGKPNVFQVEDFSALHATTEATFADAVATARRYSANGSGECPATIIDSHGCEWRVWGNGDAENVSCPAVAASRSMWCECGMV